MPEVKALTPINPNSVDAREGLAVGEYAIYRMSEIAALRQERDSAVNVTVRKCAKAICQYCAAGHYRQPANGVHYWDNGASTACCLANPIRRAFPAAFGEEKDVQA